MANNQNSDAIEMAILQAMSSHEDYEEGDMLVEWLVIGYASNPARDTDAYPMFFSNGTMPTHRARGLLHTGLKMMNADDD